MTKTTKNSEKPSDEEILGGYKGEPAPLLPLLHAFQERDGAITGEAIQVLARALRIPEAELFGTVSFYPRFRLEAGLWDRDEHRVQPPSPYLAEMEEDEAPLPPPCPLLQAGEAGSAEAASAETASAETPAFEECVFRDLRKPGQRRIEVYREGGGYRALERLLAVKDQSARAEEILDCLDQSGLAGRGGAGFPTGQKWRLVRAAEGSPKTVVCNAEEGEPGCFKDRAILDHDPHAVIEGLCLAALATGASRAFLYLAFEYPVTARIFDTALREAEAAGIPDSCGLQIYLRRTGGGYVCGEEGSLLNSLEGKHPFPRNRPPFPVTHGFEGLPTAVNNVETFAAARRILELGADWYGALGLGVHKGTKIISLSGDIERPGNYEVPFGLPLRVLLEDWAGGAKGGRSIQAVTMAGVSGGYLAGEDLDVTLDEPSIRAKGSFLGAGGVLVFDDTRDMRVVTRDILAFFAEESCGKCFPCRIGTQRLVERLGEASPVHGDARLREMRDISETMQATSACGLGIAAPLVVDKLLRYFPDALTGGVET